ncbi:conserved hypothetical protein, partial [Ricinus communis]
ASAGSASPARASASLPSSVNRPKPAPSRAPSAWPSSTGGRARSAPSAAPAAMQTTAYGIRSPLPSRAAPQKPATDSNMPSRQQRSGPHLRASA